MNDVSLTQSAFSLLLGIGVIVLLTTRYKLHAFFALLLACVIMGLGLQLSVPLFLQTVKSGFGTIIGSLGLIIMLGTLLGFVMEYTGCTLVLANAILRRTGKEKSALAMNITGYTVGLPIFCDSGFMVLSSLNKTIAARTGVSITIMATALASGLYAVHCLLPPHPGAAAATATLEASFGKVVLYGMLVAIPTALCGYLWARHMGRKMPTIHTEPIATTAQNDPPKPHIVRAALPIFLPIILIGIHAFVAVGQSEVSPALNILHKLGIPEVALSIGVLLALSAKPRWRADELNPILRNAVEKAAEILVIIGAGGAFGAIIAQANIAEHFAGNAVVAGMGIWFPFFVAAILKTAQGSSSVAIITAASIVLPMLHSLGLDSETGRILAVLATGAGSMVISHANDSYFWVIAKFSGIGMSPMLRVYTVATLIMGVAAMVSIYILSLVI